MAHYDNEINVINDFFSCKDSEIYLFNEKNEKILQNVRNFEEWNCSSSKSDPPPDFFSDKYKLMLEVMRVDDHAYINEKGKIINPHIKKENETYKEIQKFVRDNNILYSGDIIVNTVTDLPTQDDHSYDKYIVNFKRVIENHDSSYDLYKTNHKNHKLIYLILDESSSYMEKEGFNVNNSSVGDIVQAKLHLFFFDEKFVSVLKNSKADYFIWYAPFKHFDSKEKIELPQAVIYSKTDLKKINTIKYNINSMYSIEK